MFRRVPFNLVFALLLLSAGLCAFVLPQPLTDRARGNLDLLLSPVAWPVWQATIRLAAPRGVLASTGTKEDRDADQSLAKIEELKTENASLKRQNEELNRINAERAVLPERDLCRAFRVMGGDAGTRRTLKLVGSSFNGLAAKMPVLCPQGLVGRIEIAGPGGASVILVTDLGFRVTGQFWRHRRIGQSEKYEWVQLNAPPIVAAGDGKDSLTVENLKIEEVKAAGLAVGDSVMLADRDWPEAVQRRRLGDIERIVPLQNERFARIMVRPTADLAGLKDVLVLVNTQRTP